MFDAVSPVKSPSDNHSCTQPCPEFVWLVQGDDRIDPTEWRFLISGMSPGQSQMENPDPSWIEANVWGEIKALCGIPYFEEFAAVFAQRTVAWRRFVGSLSRSPVLEGNKHAAALSVFVSRFRHASSRTTRCLLHTLRCFSLLRVVNEVPGCCFHFFQGTAAYCLA